MEGGIVRGDGSAMSREYYERPTTFSQKWVAIVLNYLYSWHESESKHRCIHDDNEFVTQKLDVAMVFVW